MIPAMRPIVIAANWKMHTLPSEAATLAATIAGRTMDSDVVRIICPPFVALEPVRDALAGTGVAVGAQNCHHEVVGAYTGEVSAAMLVGLAEWVIVGHSERRRDACESDALIAAKLQRALEAGLRPILCVGEQLAEREAGIHGSIVERQLRGALAPYVVDGGGGRIFKRLVVAYEPVWAIGTGRSASGRDAAAMALSVRRTLADLGAPAAGEDVPLLYGGSTTAANIAEFLAEPGIDGALVGGASLKPDEMAGIVGRAGIVARARRAAAS